ncbi:melanopsin-B-like isoform X2 [Hydra vulgaris]|uniref:Melanopsin-B-like isoform X2 n=1 Tax=Hydra vulgaris TaxID=6087 RepID=A0ABM4BAK6_HYDVU
MDAVKIILLIITSVAVLTNSISLYFLYKKHKKNNYVILCINLCVSDLLQSIAGYIPALFFDANMQKATTLCKLSAFFIAFPSFTTIAMLSAMALSRMVLLSLCFDSNQINYKKLFIRIGVASWIYGFIWAVLPFLGFSSYTLENTRARCSVNFAPKTSVEKLYLILLMAFGFVIPLISIIASCLFTARVITTKYKYFCVTYGKDNDETKRYKEKERKAFFSFLIMVLSFVVCWTPYATIGCFSAFTSLKVPQWLLHVASFFGKLSALVNPFIYYWKDGLFKKSFLNKRFKATKIFLIKKSGKQPS